MVSTRRRSARLQKLNADDAPETTDNNNHEEETTETNDVRGDGSEGNEPDTPNESSNVDDDDDDDEEDDDAPEASESNNNSSSSSSNTKRKAKNQKKKELQKQRKEQLKSKTTGVGLKISVASEAAVNNKIVFDDSNLPASDDNDNDNESNNDNEEEPSEVPATRDAKENEEQEEEEDDDDAVEEVKGSAARDEVLDQMKTEERQSQKSKKKKKRKRKDRTKQKEAEKEYGSDDDDMDDDFFAHLDSVREKEAREEQKAQKTSRAIARGKHTTFVFAENKDEDEGAAAPPRDPVPIDDALQVVVLRDPSSSTPSGGPAPISDAALACSRNRLTNGSDPGAGPTEAKRKRNRSGEEAQPWKRVARPRLAMGRSRMTKGKPAAFFTKKKRKR
eukprot:jgi/Psemu1/43164/gm1.43164_g